MSNKKLDLNVFCPKCNSNKFVAGKAFGSGVVLRCAMCSAPNGEPTYIKNVNNVVFGALQERGQILKSPQTKAALGLATPEQAPQGYAAQGNMGVAASANNGIYYAQSAPPDPYAKPVPDNPYSYLPQTGIDPTPTEYPAAQGLPFDSPVCTCCDPSCNGTAYDSFGMPLVSEQFNSYIRDGLLTVKTTGIDAKTVLTMAVKFCPYCGRRL